MTDKLALGERANHGTLAQAFVTTTERQVSRPRSCNRLSTTTQQRRAAGALDTQYQPSQDAQVRATQCNTELVVEAIGAAAKAHRRHMHTMSGVSQGLRGGCPWNRRRPSWLAKQETSDLISRSPWAKRWANYPAPLAMQ